MRACDLTDDDIGTSLLVPYPTGLGRRRLVFEGLSRRIAHPVVSPRGDDSEFSPHWLIMRCGPGVEGVLRLRDLDGNELTGILVRSTAVVTRLEVDYAVTAAGEIVELRATASQ